MSYTIIKHGEEGLYQYEFQCKCGCQFLCDYSDIRHESIHINWDEFTDVWHVKCPECRNHISVDKLNKVKVK